jgi:hypothetical protein
MLPRMALMACTTRGMISWTALSAATRSPRRRCSKNLHGRPAAAHHGWLLVSYTSCFAQTGEVCDSLNVRQRSRSTLCMMPSQCTACQRHADNRQAGKGS